MKNLTIAFLGWFTLAQANEEPPSGIQIVSLITSCPDEFSEAARGSQGVRQISRATQDGKNIYRVRFYKNGDSRFFRIEDSSTLIIEETLIPPYGPVSGNVKCRVEVANS